ncbi:MAG: chromate efflux transporter [Bacteroidota bacterium]
MPDLESPTESSPSDSPARRLIELARLFFTLGVVGFGGPAAHIAMMDEEVVQKRKWLSRQHFLDLIGATSLIPGPNSTEMTMHVGYARGGWLGLFVAGVSFIVPAAGLTLALAWLYVAYGTIPDVQPALAGIQSAVLAIILGALWKLGKKAITSPTLGAVALVACIPLIAGIGELPVLFTATIVGALVVWWQRTDRRTPPSDDPGPDGEASDDPRPPSASSALGKTASAALLVAGPLGGATPSLWTLGFFFLKVGAVLYGSGYVLIAFLEGDVVGRYEWLTSQQLLDAVALGQLTPGPVLTTATAVGYFVAGVPGALVATLGIFLPSFLFAGILHPIVPRLRKAAWSAALLDAVNAVAVALMAVVTVRLALATLTGSALWAIFALASGWVLWKKPSVVWVVALGAALGWGASVLGV